MTELEKPSVILRREAEKPVVNWTRKELYQRLPTNNHMEMCRCHLAVIQDRLVENGALDSVESSSTDAVARRIASIYNRDPEIFMDAVIQNDRLGDKDQGLVLAAFDANRSYFSPEIYRAYQTIAPAKLYELADYYEGHGL